MCEMVHSTPHSRVAKVLVEETLTVMKKNLMIATANRAVKLGMAITSSVQMLSVQSAKAAAKTKVLTKIRLAAIWKVAVTVTVPAEVISVATA